MTLLFQVLKTKAKSDQLANTELLGKAADVVEKSELLETAADVVANAEGLEVQANAEEEKSETE